MSIGDIVNYQNMVAVVINDNPIVIATNQGTTLTVSEGDITLLLSRSFVLEEFAKCLAIRNIGAKTFTKGSIVMCNDLVGYVISTNKNQACIVDVEGVPRWVLCKAVNELCNPHALALLLYDRIAAKCSKGGI